ncbi:hypothetical protein CW357_17425 [Rummeliibacillus sp. TYF005]|uniref:RHS repeat-associated core domain-containing protein n=1 Tax=Rummeliibacillus sp. TYF005 TaxID=2058214 RepID=UPI000F539E3B|nr:RHS repeat-associated core domain-containing protein [Rummeliibacillus sp. TYF005]RPJ94060.1 hypothetical protein CW357_17425 [Rummeliibacillus sp. TYF005]
MEYKVTFSVLGYYDDEETKNYYLQARYYNPENGAFLALDPHPGDGEEPLLQNGYSYGNNNPVMNIDSNGIKPNRVYYAIMTGILYVANEITGTLKDAYLMGMLLYDSIKGYLDVKKAKKETLTKNASKTIKDSRTLRKVIEKKARKAAKKAGVKAIGKSLGGYYLLYRFSIGVTQGGRNKYFKYAPCYRSAYAYAKYVVKTRLG